MTITIKIARDTKQRLQRNAQAQGKPQSDYVEELVERASQIPMSGALALPRPPLAHLTPAEQNKAIDAMIANTPAAPSHPDSAHDRGQIYP